MILGLLGNPVSISWSELLFNRIFEIEGNRNAYYAINASPHTINRIIDTNISPYDGFNVTAPYKEYILNFATDREPLVWKTGSSNVIKKYSGGYSAFNVDYIGFDFTLKKNHVNLDGKRVGIVGSGGVSKTILYYVLTNSSPELLDILTTNMEKAGERIKGTWQYSNMAIKPYDSADEYDVLINCTPLGMRKTDRDPAPNSKISNKGFLIDLTYQQEETKFMEKAKLFNAGAVNGRDMFFEQARETYRIFFDNYPENPLFERAREDVLNWAGKS